MILSPRRLGWWLALAAVLAPLTAARAQVPPDERWRVLDTEHFRVHFTPGLDSLAGRAAVRAEAAYAELREALIRPPGGRIDLVVTDNADFANGFANTFPRNRVVVFAHPPVDDPGLAFFDDWLDLVITHELAHVFHLDYARGVPRAIRSVFGRIPLSFPSPTVPRWTTEGLATWLESRLTRAGRVRGTMQEMALRTAVLEGRFFEIDRASGDPASWPGGNAAYFYGAMFLDWLAEREGGEAAGEFVRTYGGRVVPFLVDRAARKAYGVSFSRAWDEWERELQGRYRALADSLRARGLTEPEVLTTAGYYARFPRWSPDGRRIAFSAYTGRDEPSTRVIEADGRVRVLAPRTLLAASAWEASGGSLVTSMVDLVDPYRQYADLYRIAGDGDVDRLTRGARLTEVDVARDGRIAAVRSAPGTNQPVVLAAPGAEPAPLVEASLDVHWAYPRWSPDGTRIAISRWRRGGRYDVVVLDAASGRVAAEATDDRAVDMAPAWSPDGRYVLFSSDRTGISNLYAFDTRDGRLLQVTNVLTGAFEPDVSPDGRWIAFAWYRSDGYHVARIPFDPSAWRPAPPVRAEVREGEAPPPAAPAARTAERRYSPWRSLRPTWWEPTLLTREALGTAVGAATGGHDVVERHLWAAFGQVYGDEARFEGALGYLFRGLGNPTLGASAFQDWDVLIAAGVLAGPGDAPIPTALLERERSASVVATFARPRYRSYAWLSLGATVRDRKRVFDDPEQASGVTVVDPPPDVGAVATLGWSTVRAYDFSISAEDGVVAAASVEARRFTREIEGEDVLRGYTRLAGRTQAYRGFRAWGFARHVLAVRVAGGVDAGSRAPGFAVGGNGGLALAFPLSTGTGLGDTPDLPVRGYPEGSQVGDRAVAATAEYRFPIALVERGLGLVPVYLDRLWGTAFADAGTAWCVEICDPVVPFEDIDMIGSVGAELGADVTFGFNVRMRLRAGVAFPLSETPTRGGGFTRPKPEAYFLFGQSF
ncbi:MAG TPA: hypothetical protein VF746_27825 [Longimicrobium sp.]|jgi:hypothetical protein